MPDLSHSAYAAPVAPGPLDARLLLPGSKSLTNRELVLAALADGPSVLRRPLHARDAELMAQALRDLAWDDTTEYLPAIIVAIAMPFTFSIATGIGLGFIAYALVKTLAGRPGSVSGAVWVIAAASAVKFGLA